MRTSVNKGWDLPESKWNKSMFLEDLIVWIPLHCDQNIVGIFKISRLYILISSAEVYLSSICYCRQNEQKSSASMKCSSC